MSLLDANSNELATAAMNSRWAPAKTPEPGVFTNFGSTAGNYFMRSMAEVGRSASMAAGAIPVAVDKVVGKDNFSGKSLSDRYFEFHDEVFGRAVDHWTPRPEETGKAGQVVGSLAGGIVQFLASPALAVANAQLSTSEDLVRQGVDADAAILAGDVAGLGTVAGIALPIAGKSLAQRVATGVAGNLGQSVATAAATQQILGAADAPESVKAQFDPLDPTGRTVDVLMGAVFGAKAHLDSRVNSLTQTQKDALLLLNQSKHLESASTPGRAVSEADFVSAVDGVRTAIDQMVRGQPVSVEAPLRFEPDEVQAAQRAQMQQVVDEALPPETLVPSPRMLEAEAPRSATTDQQAKQDAIESMPRFDENIRLPTGEFDPKTGEPTTISANDFIARAQEDAAQVKTTAPRLLAAAAECLLGSI